MRPLLERSPPAPEEEYQGYGNPAFDATLASILSGESTVVFHYQPIVDLRRGLIAGYEALARFPSTMGDSPDVGFAAAALVDKKMELEEVVVRTAMRSKAFLPRDCFLSINMSPAFLLSPRWDALLSSHTTLSGFVIEVTEEESISDYESIRGKLTQIRALDGCVAVDDAGAGYASLQHVLEMRPSFIKLDRTFIKNCHSERAKSVLIEMLGRAANRLDAWIIAEGVETQQELGELIHLEVPLGQGYHLGRPHPEMRPIIEANAAWIRSRIRRQNSGDSLLPHLEICPVRSTQQEAEQLLAAHAVSTVVVTDTWDRPVKIFERHPLLGERRLVDIMKIQIATNPTEVLQRALTRPVISRFDPFAVIDSRGVLQGIVRIDRLMCALLDATTPQP